MTPSAMEVTLGKDASGAILTDFEAILLSFLPDYEKVIETSEATFSIPTVGSLQTSNIILKRKRPDLVVTDPRGAAFEDQVLLLGRPALRNWQSVQVTMGRAEFLFLNTHLESFNGTVNLAQALGLIAGPLNTKLHVVAVGDFNTRSSEPYGEAYKALTGAGNLKDLVRDGDTCCRAELLSVKDAPLTSRIDFVFVNSGSITLRSGKRIGVEQVGGLYPSDHAGLFADLNFVTRWSPLAKLRSRQIR